MTGSISLASKTPGPPGAKGSTGSTGAGADGLWVPADNGLLAWTMDPVVATSNVTTSAGILYLMRVKMATEAAVSRVGLNLRTTAAAGLANTYVGVYSISGSTATLIGGSADISSGVNGVTAPTLYSLAAPTASQAAGTSLFVAFLAGSGTTLPTMIGTTGRSNAFIVAKASYRSLAFGAGLAALPASVDLTAAVDGGSVPLMALAA